MIFGLFDTTFDSERLKHTLDDMRKFTGRQLVEHAAHHLPKVYASVFQENAEKTIFTTLRTQRLSGSNSLFAS